MVVQIDGQGPIGPGKPPSCENSVNGPICQNMKDFAISFSYVKKEIGNYLDIWGVNERGGNEYLALQPPPPQYILL